MEAVDLRTFLGRHLPALEERQAEFNLMLGLLNRAGKAPEKVRLWSFGAGTACALQTPPHMLTLGDLTPDQCAELATATKDLEFAGCIGPEGASLEMASALARLGIGLRLDKRLGLHTLTAPPVFPGAGGSGRLARREDEDLYVGWAMEFAKETGAILYSPERFRADFGDRPVFFWEVNGEPVAMAARTRETKDGSNISLVFTPPELRGKGYGASVTAFASEQTFREGKALAFLYTDLANPVSNKIYARIGYRLIATDASYLRAPA